MYNSVSEYIENRHIMKEPIQGGALNRGLLLCVRCRHQRAVSGTISKNQWTEVQTIA